MADFISSSLFSSNPPYSATVAHPANDDCLEDVCSICLESFDTQDPPTTTKCKHEYHLQCILEWSQRSKECPICWQVLVLQDPSSQELLAAVENERSLRSRIKIRNVYEDPEINHETTYTDDSDYDERTVWNFATASRAHYVTQRGRQRSLVVGPSQVRPSSPEEFQSSGYESSEADSPTSSMASTTINDQESVAAVAPVVNVVTDNVSFRDTQVKARLIYSQQPTDSPWKPSSSELLTFSESIKSRFSAASSRYKESISKGTRGLKEKLLPRNSSVKELSKGVQREMSAGLAGVAKMIERLDLASKRTEAPPVPLSDCEVQTSNSSFKGKSVQSTGDTSSHSLPHISNTVSGQRVEVSHVQKANLYGRVTLRTVLGLT